MKKCLAILAILALVGGCAAVSSFLCHPTDSQTIAANVGIATAQSILTALAFYTGNPVVALVSQNALPVFRKVAQGYCVTAVDWDSAVNALQQAQTEAKKNMIMSKAIMTEDAIAYLKTVKW